MISITASSFWEVIPEDVTGMSVVFHCNDGTRAFCGIFVESNTSANYTVPDQVYQEGAVEADFSDELSDDSMVYMDPNGNLSMVIDASDITDNTGCSEWSYGIFEAGDSVLAGSAVGEDCESYVGDFWDPTHQCPPFSGSEYCWGTDYLCNDTHYAYDCHFDYDRYSCAPGDLSGKFGTMDDLEFSLDVEGPRTLLPMMDDMIFKMFAIYCGDNDSGISYLACASIYTVTPEPTPAPTPAPIDGSGDGAAERTVIMSVVAMVFAMLF